MHYLVINFIKTSRKYDLMITYFMNTTYYALRTKKNIIIYCIVYASICSMPYVFINELIC